MNAAAPTVPAPKPWFREPWPWLLMAGPATVVVAGIATAVIAFRGADGLVADDYYKKGLGINRELAREASARNLGIAGEIAITGGVVRARITSHSALPDRMRLRFAHPTRAGEDREVFLARVGDDAYTAPLPGIAPGRWRLILESGTWRVSVLADTRESVPVKLDASGG